MNRYFKNIRLITILILQFAIVFILLSEVTSYKATTNPDFLHYETFSNELASSGNMYICSELNKQFDTNVFGARGFQLINDTCYTHGSLHGYIIIWGWVKLFFAGFLPFILSISSVLLSYFTYKLARLRLDKRHSYQVMIVTFLSAGIFTYSVVPFNNIMASSLFIASLYYYLRGFIMSRNTPTNNSVVLYLLLGGLLAGITAWIRYELLAILGLTVVLLIVIFRPKLKLIVYSGFFTSLLLALLLFVNYDLYGNPLSFGSQSGDALASVQYYGSDIETYKILPLVPPVSLDLYQKNFLVYLVEYSPLLLIGFLILFADVRRAITKLKHKYLLILLFPAIMLILLYFGSIWSGVYQNAFTVATSYVRYMLPGYIILSVLGYIFLSTSKLSKYVKQGVYFVSILWGLFFAIYPWGALNFHILAQSRFVQVKEDYLSKIEPGSVVFVAQRDKYIYPDRETVIYASFPVNTGVADTVDLIERLVLAGYKVYFSSEDVGVGEVKQYFTSDYLNSLPDSLKYERVSEEFIKISLDE